LVSDVRSGIQVASAEGKASKMNFSLGGWGWVAWVGLQAGAIPKRLRASLSRPVYSTTKTILSERFGISLAW
jgi:hypothetical protein